MLSMTIASSPGQEDLLKQEVVELREECSSTYLTKRNTYISFYYGSPIYYLDETNNYLPLENQDSKFNRTTNSYSGASYINNKYFQVGYSNIYTSSLMVGKSSLIGPNGLTPEYQTVYGLTLPNINTNIYSIRSAGFVFKRKSGTLSNLQIYNVNSPTYPYINGSASLSKTYINSISISTSYSTLDITDEVVSTLSISSYSLNLLLVGTTNNSTCNLYKADDNISSRPYFYIEYDNYGNTIDYYDGSSTLINCFGYALFQPYGRNIHNDLQSFGLTDSNCESVMQSFFSYYSNLFDVSDIYRITSYNSQIPSSYRRIAFRFYIDNNGAYTSGYHFMWQHLGGGWADKSGFELYYGHDNDEDAPEKSSHWMSNNGEYNSDLYYFAIQQTI